MRPNTLGQMLLTACNEQRFAILKALQMNKIMTTEQIREWIKLPRQINHYHLRTLANYQLITKTENSRVCKITKKGIEIIKLIESTLSEKYIDASSCRNSNNGAHDFMLVCRKCCYIHSGKEKCID